MAYLDNSGDIILDTVLTDAGRERMARGDGSAKIVKFALFDDEIDYGLYNKTHTSGSAYYDLNILQLPVLEAIANNTSFGNSKLITINRKNLLYLPVLKLNEIFEASTARHTVGAFVVAVNKDSEDELAVVSGANIAGIMLGESVDGGSYIRVDQGLDTSAIPPTTRLDPDLVETQYIIRIDNRFGSIVSKVSGNPADISFVDDDNVATYLLNLGTDPEFVVRNSDTTTGTKQTIAGPRGTYLQFRLRSSLELNTSTYLLNEIGQNTTMTGVSGTVTVDYIDAIVRVEGATTGMVVDVPVRFVRKQ